jgi:lipopolysaccharide export LptBFGC system permease protein LptF
VTYKKITLITKHKRFKNDSSVCIVLLLPVTLMLLLIYHSHGIKFVATNLSFNPIGHHIQTRASSTPTLSNRGLIPFPRSKPNSNIDMNDSNDISHQLMLSNTEKENESSKDSKGVFLAKIVRILIGVFASFLGVVLFFPNGMMSDSGTPRAHSAATVGIFASLLFVIGGISFAIGAPFGLWTLLSAVTLQITALLIIGK